MSRTRHLRTSFEEALHRFERRRFKATLDCLRKARRHRVFGCHECLMMALCFEKLRKPRKARQAYLDAVSAVAQRYERYLHWDAVERSVREVYREMRKKLGLRPGPAWCC
jgi:hypothetical protein